MLSSSYACEFSLHSTENFLGCKNLKRVEKICLNNAEILYEAKHLIISSVLQFIHFPQ